ncbi:MAG: RRXRR domain-containing protein [Desulfovibrio sp.]|jgi:hypothetical protein|nr:RRXRR domain-containing protein [Desulfovibrio sp.]
MPKERAVDPASAVASGTVGEGNGYRDMQEEKAQADRPRKGTEDGRAMAPERTVRIVNRDGQVLDPTTSARADAMIRDGKASVLCRCPFTIKLTYHARSCTAPPVIYGDMGSAHVGAVADDDRNVPLRKRETVQRTDVNGRQDIGVRDGR